MTGAGALSTLNAMRERGLRKLLPGKPRIGVGLGTCGVGNGARNVYQALVGALDRRGVDADVTTIGCFGFCAAEPLVNIWLPGKPLVVMERVGQDDVDEIADALAAGTVLEAKALCRIERWDHLTAEIEYGTGFGSIPLWNEVPFYAGQKKIVLRNCGLINPEDIEEYAAVGGYRGALKALTELSSDEVIEEVKKAKLRGRGGAGFPTGNKWDILRKQPGDEKYIVCNADEGDPGAYMNRNELESDPHALLEGMLIGGYAMQASIGIIYVRAEYPLAVIRLERAVEQARRAGLLGKKIMGTEFNFDLEIVEGAGAFVCGEETALIASLEGRAGRPRSRPPFPAQSGLWGQPTNINNVETWYSVAPIVVNGGDWFAETGTPKSAGTKVFSLVGKVKNTGLVEMPLGKPLRDVIYGIGGGTGTGKGVKAVQTGGPSGGCIPARLFDSTIDYESLASIGSIMGSGGIVVMDEDNCMVDKAGYFVEFTRSESCGKCVPCRVGLDHAHRILRGICEGHSGPDDLAQLEELGAMIKDTALCGLGQTGPNPVLTTLKHFREEYEDHMIAGRCPATECEKLFLSPCENSCPLHMNIPGYLTLIREGRLDEAFELVLLDNPLPASTGRVCQHPCEQRCRRGEIDAAVAIRDVHRFVADQLFAKNRDKEVMKLLVGRKLPDTGKKVAVVGAGPAGISAAFYLALLGYRVTVYEAFPKPGGLLRYGLPGYREPKDMLDREISFTKGLGVEFVCGTRVGTDISLDDLEKKNDAVVVAVGTWKEQDLDVPGSNLPGVIGAVDFLEAVNRGENRKIGKKVVVVGGGNSAIDSARTSLRLGAEVTVVYRREKQDMPAIAEEVLEAEEEGVKFVFLAIPKEIQSRGRKGITGFEVTRARAGAFDSYGRRVPEPTNETFVVECDTVILAIGEKVDGDLMRKLGIGHDRNDRATPDRFTLRTNREKVYAVGDMVSGPANVSTAMGYGKRAAGQIDLALGGADRLAQVRSRASYGQEVPLGAEGGPRNTAHGIPVAQRQGSFGEVIPGLSDQAAFREAQRCLRCDVKVTAGDRTSTGA
jgi:NADH-quinone oxidoreductase subunit F